MLPHDIILMDITLNTSKSSTSYVVTTNKVCMQSEPWRINMGFKTAVMNRSNVPVHQTYATNLLINASMKQQNSSLCSPHRHLTPRGRGREGIL